MKPAFPNEAPFEISGLLPSVTHPFFSHPRRGARSGPSHSAGSTFIGCVGLQDEEIGRHRLTEAFSKNWDRVRSPRLASADHPTTVAGLPEMAGGFPQRTRNKCSSTALCRLESCVGTSETAAGVWERPLIGIDPEGGQPVVTMVRMIPTSVL